MATRKDPNVFLVNGLMEVLDHFVYVGRSIE